MSGVAGRLRADGFEPAARVTGAVAYRRQDDPRPIDLKLDANEGPPLPSPTIADLAAPALRDVHEYPDQRALEQALAAYVGVDAERLVVTAGGDDALARLAQVALEPGREALVTRPTFDMIGRYIRLAGGVAVESDWMDGPFPTDAMIARVTPRTAAIFVVSPNNPTGGVARADDLRRLSAAAPGALLVLDHAYAEFADEDLTHAALALPNAVVVRTLSKAWGVAGLRVGYAVGSAALVEALRAVGQPYAVSRPAAAAGLVRLMTGAAAMRAGVDQVRSERSRLTALLQELGARTLSTQANFVAATWPAGSQLAGELLGGLGIAVRVFKNPGPMQDYLRITCPANSAAFERLSHALRTVRQPDALLFDMDGVLADVSRSYRRAILDTAAGFGVTLSAQDVAAAKAEGDANNDWVLTHRLITRRGVAATLAEVTTRFEALYQGEPGRPGLRQTETLLVTRERLAALATRVKLGVVTGRPRRDAQTFLEAHGLADLFPVVVCMEDAPLKPDPAPVRLAMQRLGVRAAWMIGDTVDDVRSARAAGVLPMAVLAPGQESRSPQAAAAAKDVLLRAGAAMVADRVDQILEIAP